MQITETKIIALMNETDNIDEHCFPMFVRNAIR